MLLLCIRFYISRASGGSAADVEPGIKNLSHNGFPTGDHSESAFTRSPARPPDEWAKRSYVSWQSVLCDASRRE
jgi:hypothetical protein